MSIEQIKLVETQAAPRPGVGFILRPVRGLLGQASVVVAVFVVWESAVRSFGLRPDLLPAPSRVFQAGWNDRERLWTHAEYTLIEVAIGVCAAFVVAGLMATFLDFFPKTSKPILSLFVGAQAIPVVAIAPLVVIWFGFGLLPKILLILLVTFFPLTIAALEGLNSADNEATRLLRSAGANRFQIYWHLRLPSALPFIFTGLRVVTSYAVSAAIFAEYVGSHRGLGIYLLITKNSLRTDLMFAAVMIAVAFSVALFMLTYLLEAIVAPWQRRQRKAAK